MTDAERWRPCSACKKPIEYGAEHWVCSVSTCNRKRTGLVFCSVSCWEVHLPVANHREAWALEATAPRESEAPMATVSKSAPRPGPRRIIPTATSPAPAHGATEVLVVASRLKDYVRDRAGFNTSDRVLEPLSKIVRQACDRAIQNARRDGRKTILDRDVPTD